MATTQKEFQATPEHSKVRNASMEYNLTVVGKDYILILFHEAWLLYIV